MGKVVWILWAQTDVCQPALLISSYLSLKSGCVVLKVIAHSVTTMFRGNVGRAYKLMQRDRGVGRAYKLVEPTASRPQQLHASGITHVL